MSAFAKIVAIKETDNVVKPSATIEVRRYWKNTRMPHITVHLSTGWPMDRPETHRTSSRVDAKKLVRDWLRD